MANCLVIIDVQKGFIKTDGNSILPRKIVELTKKFPFDHIVCTKFRNKDGGPFDELMGWREMKDDESCKLAPEIESISERVFNKCRYTCFTPEFKQYIKENDIDKLYFVGLDTDCCVLASAIDCFERNIPLEVLAKYCASSGGERCHYLGLTILERLVGKNAINYEE